MMRKTHALTIDQYRVTHTVGADQHGTRLDHFLKGHYSRRSRAQLQKFINGGAVEIFRLFCQSGKPKASSTLQAGDEIRVFSDRKPEPEVDFNYSVLFEDDALLVVNKPAHLPVHPAGKYFFHTLLVHLQTEALKHSKDQSASDFFLVHRIDKETSGVLVLAKTREACAHLTKQFSDRTPKKTYLAIVKGIPPLSFKVDLPVMRDPHSAISLKMTTSTEEKGGQPAFTEFKRLKTFQEFSIVECNPKTGRQHQIRVHLEAAGFPIVGDKLYGLQEEVSVPFFERRALPSDWLSKLLLPRHALHAFSIEMSHPLTQSQIRFEAPFPPDLLEFSNR